jgi:hypothetical protein
MNDRTRFGSSYRGARNPQQARCLQAAILCCYFQVWIGQPAFSACSTQHRVRVHHMREIHLQQQRQIIA